MLFLSFQNIDIELVELKELTWQSYDIAKALSTTSWVELIDKREFAEVTLDENFEIFMIHIVILKVPTVMPIHPFKPSQV